MADGIKIRALNQTTLIDDTDVLIIDKADAFGDSSLTYYITYADVKTDLFTGDITIDGSLTVNNDLSVGGNSSFSGTVNIDGRLTVTGTIETENINVSNNANINLDQLLDVEVGGAQPDDYLMYNGTNWVVGQPSSGETGGQSGEYIMFKGGPTPITFKVTVGPKTTSNQFYGFGSINCFYIDGVECPNIMLPAGRTFIFDQSDSSNTGRRFNFFEEQSESVISSPSSKPGLSINGIPGFAGAQTVLTFSSEFHPTFGTITEQTPGRLFYRCENPNGLVDEYMGATIVNVAYALEAKIGDIDAGGDSGGGGFPGFPSNMTLTQALADLDRRIGTVEGTVLELE